MKQQIRISRKGAGFVVWFVLTAMLMIGCGGGGETRSSGSTPVVTTLAATSVAPTGAILNGSVIPNGLQTQSWFEYGIDSALGTFTSSSKQDAGNGLTSQAANVTWSGLAGGTTYYFRVCAENSSGYSKGNIISFTTSSPGSPPTVTTLSATSVGATGATLNGSVSPNGLETIAWFEYGTDSTLASSTSTPSQSVGSGTTSLSVNAVLTGLTTGTTYYCRVAASNSSGTTKGNILSFIPGAGSAEAPTVTTLPATSIGGTRATLNGNVNANGLPTTAWFEWGRDPSFSTYPGYPTFSFTPSQSVGSGTTSQLVTDDITGLAIGVTYYYRVVAYNGSGATRGSVLSIGPFGAPFVTTLAATSVGATTAELNGIVTPNGMGTTTWFEYDTDPTLASSTSTSSQLVGSGTTNLSVNAVLTGLTTGTTYYYRVAASNSSGTTKGNIASVTIGTVPGPGEWTATGLMVAPRSGHTATLLPGGKVLVAGGYVPTPTFAYLSSAELYDSTTGTWVNTGSMATARVGHTATLLPGGKVLVAGGEQYMIGIFSSVVLYDSTTGTWVNTGSMGTARVGHTATLLQNGKVLVVGGKDYGFCSYGGCSPHFSSSAELYDPATGTWDNTGSFTVLGRGPGYTATLLSNGKVLVAGGNNILGASPSGELYDPTTGTWTSTGSMATARWYHTATLLPNGKILVAGGIDNADGITSSAELYDPATGNWENTGSMAIARRGPTATLLPNGKVLVAGGWKGGGDSGYLASAELYDPATGTWVNTGLMVAPRISHTATLLSNGKVLVAGGGYYSGGTGTLPAMAELYNP